MTKTISEGYQISNSPDNYSVVFVSKKDFPKLKKLYKKMAGMETVSMIDLKDMSDTLCCSLGLSPITIKFSGVQPHSNTSEGNTRSKTMGAFSQKGTSCWIQVYKFTAKTKKEYAPKSVMSTLFHEITHYYDTKILKIKSVHSLGFYRRISSIEAEIK